MAMRPEGVVQLKGLEKENSRLKRIVAEQTSPCCGRCPGETSDPGASTQSGQKALRPLRGIGTPGLSGLWGPRMSSHPIDLVLLQPRDHSGGGGPQRGLGGPFRRLPGPCWATLRPPRPSRGGSLKAGYTSCSPTSSRSTPCSSIVSTCSSSSNWADEGSRSRG